MGQDFDLVVIGSGPTGEKAAVKAAYFGKRVAVVESFPVMGGECRTAGLPSKVLREAALSYSGARRRLGDLFHVTPGEPMRMQSFLHACDQMCATHADRVVGNFERHGVTCLRGRARLIDVHRLVVTGADGSETAIGAGVILVATGSRPVQPDYIPFGQPGIHLSDSVLHMERLPRTLTVVGAGVIGTEYASIFQALGVKVTLIDGRPRVLGFLDHEIHDRLLGELRERGMRTLLGHQVTGCRVRGAGVVEVETDQGAGVRSEALLFSGGRNANTEGLGLEEVGVAIGRHGRPVVDQTFRTSVPNIFAAGDVIGFPALASTGMEQGRVAVAAAFPLSEAAERPDVLPLESTHPYPLLPYGIYTIPSMSMVGQTEEQVVASGRPYVVGRASYSDQDRGRLIGDATGLLKLICDRETREVLGVHIVGETAEELVHIGQACMHFGGTIEYFLRTVFNFPTLAALYKAAAYDVLVRLGPERHRFAFGEASR
jgi:NAD(P) transhydrogenase